MSDTTQVRVIDDAAVDERDFIPGAGKASLMWSYDLMTALAGVGSSLDRLVELAGISTGHRVLDVGCGTGNLALRAAAAGAVVTGLDPDRGALARAARKARRRGLGLTLVRGYADRLPADDASVDRVISSFALHHVPTDQKAAMTAELLRVLRPGGTVTILDFAGDAGHVHGSGAHGSGAHDHGSGSHQGHDSHAHRGRGHGGGGWWSRRVGRTAYVADNQDHGIVRLLRDAGLTDVTERETRRIHRLPVAYVQARRPS